MKTLLLSTLLFGAFTLATSPQASADGIDSHLKSIQNKIRSCTVLPYTVKQQRRVYHSLVSHCSEVRVLSNGKAAIKVGSRIFDLMLVETVFSDGDLYDLIIRERQTHEQFRFQNVLAFGDVLLGVLGGRIEGLRQSWVASPQ